MRKWILTLAVLALPVFPQERSVRELYVLGEHEAAMRAFATLSAPSPEERAFAVAAYTHARRQSAAKRQLEILRTAAPGNAWTYFAETSALDATYDVAATLAAGRKMMAAAGAGPDEEMVRLQASTLNTAGKNAEALALLDQSPATRRLRMTRASLLYSEPEGEKQVAAVHEALRAEAPDFVDAWVWPGRYALARRRYAEALPLLKQAAVLSTSPRIHADYWRALSSSGLTAEQKKAELERGIADLRARRGDTPEVWLAIAGDYARNGEDTAAAEWNDRILREAPNTVYAARALWNRYTAFSNKHGAEARSKPELRAQLRKIVREYLDYRIDDDEDGYRVNAYSVLYSLVKADPDASEAEIVEAVEGVRPNFAGNAGLASDAGMFLADRGVRLDLAEEVARSAFDHIPTTLMPGEIGTDLETMIRAGVHTGLGRVLLERYGPDAARNHLFAAYELSPDRPTIQYHLGLWYEARKELAKAEQRYRHGATLQSSGENPNEKALRKLYEKRYGTLAGFEAYRKSSEKADVVSRRSRILAARKKNPATAPPFALKTLDGKEVSLASLKGKTAVINFWGIWCGWCVKEMPEYQQLAKKYAADPSVAILTVNNDGDAGGVRKWMAEQKYDFAVLLDDGFVDKNKLTGFPTTWFLDPRGRIAFEQKGWTRKLLEEFSWRVEELKAAR